jgi:serine/threonine protein kinase
MRFVEGRDLGRLIADEGALEPERAVELLAQVADALDAAHRSGLVHGDVKPGNVLVDATDHAFLCDFGLAKHAVTVDSVTRDTPFAGTIDYVAPEQIHGDEIDARTDVYALGCLFFECVTGAPPFRRQTDVAVVLAHLQDDPPSIQELMPELPEALDDAVRRAARDPHAARPRPDRARALVGKRRPSIVLAAEAANPINRGVTREIEKDLERVGFEVTVLFDADPFELAKRPRPRVDALFTGWATDYPDPHGFFTAIFDPEEGLGFFPLWFEDGHWLAKIRGAARLRGDARVRAYRRLDRELTSGPIPVIPLAVDNSLPQLFSARVTCQTFLPMFFSLVDPTSLCLE